MDRDTGIRPGDIIRVTYLDRSDVMGRVLAVKRGQYNVGTNVLIRNLISRVGCEIRIPLFSTRLRNIEVIYKPKSRMPRSKHYYTRNTKYDYGDVEAYLKLKAPSKLK